MEGKREKKEYCFFSYSYSSHNSFSFWFITIQKVCVLSLVIPRYRTTDSRGLRSTGFSDNGFLGRSGNRRAPVERIKQFKHEQRHHVIIKPSLASGAHTLP